MTKDQLAIDKFKNFLFEQMILDEALNNIGLPDIINTKIIEAITINAKEIYSRFCYDQKRDLAFW